MGGDHAPEAQVEGAVLALRAGIGPVTLVGNAGEVEAELERQKVPPGTFTIVHAAETVAMDESPTYALKRKRDASIAVATRLVRDSKACALVSCGSTGAQVASSILHLGRLPGVERPAIAVAFPGTRGWGVLIDAGANAQNRPSHLVGFAVMGTLYLRHIFGVAEPRVGLVSIGEEAAKGNELVVEAHRLLGLTLGINFIGMVEGRGVYTGGADVLVCDGFVGNVLLKFSESASHWVVHHLREGMRGRPLVALGGLLMRPAFRYFRRKCSPSSIGGAPLLGVKGTSIIAHGSSDAEAVFNAIAMARRLVNERVNEKITANLRLEPPEER
ncbi:MAG TPA: phosphate acyltransferase PlsX [Candidatus Coatesbacteria bacterium]|nr:phosphate acyltransferase PlsX [Candidatus Coatesbacteria bacterium]